MSKADTAGPNYDLEIDADELAADIAALSARRARKAAEYNRDARNEPVSLDREPGQLTQYQRWAIKEEAARMAFANVIAMLQPADKYGPNSRYVDDGLVKVRALLRELSRRGSETNERRNGYDINSQQAGEEHSAYAKVISLIREDYAVGWPRFDDIGGRLQEDLP